MLQIKEILSFRKYTIKSTNDNNNHKKWNHKKEPERENKVKNKLTNILQINDESIKELGV